MKEPVFFKTGVGKCDNGTGKTTLFQSIGGMENDNYFLNQANGDEYIRPKIYNLTNEVELRRIDNESDTKISAYLTWKNRSEKASWDSDITLCFNQYPISSYSASDFPPLLFWSRI